MRKFINKATALALSLLLVCICAFPAGASSIDVTDFTIDTSAADRITVTWADSADTVLKNAAADGRTASMTIDCAFDSAYVWYVAGNRMVTSTLESGKITFDIPGAGVYRVTKGAIPDYTVTFDAKEGSEVAPQSVKMGGKITKPTDPTREGYTFSGWYSDAALTAAWDFSTGTVTQSMTLYAKWTKNAQNEAPTSPTEPTNAITKVTISPEKVTLKKGGSYQFTAKVSGTGSFDGSVTWSVSGNKDTATKISADGKLSVGANESAKELTVTVKSKQDPTKSAVATVKIRAISLLPNTGDYILPVLAAALISGTALLVLLPARSKKQGKYER